MQVATPVVERSQGRRNHDRVRGVAPPTPPPSTHSSVAKCASPRQTRSTPSRLSSTPSASSSSSLSSSSSFSPPSSSTSAATKSQADPIEPAYFYPSTSDGGSGKYSGHSRSVEDDVDAVPVFEPTMEQFRDFYSFCEQIDQWGMRSGIVKVVPPAEWTGQLPKLDADEVHRLRAVRIKNSISQMFSKAGGGAFHQKNIVHPAKVVNVKQWADLCASKEQKGPDMERMKANARAEAKARKQELRMSQYTTAAIEEQVRGGKTGDNGKKEEGEEEEEKEEEEEEEDGVRTRSGGSGLKSSSSTSARSVSASQQQQQQQQLSATPTKKANEASDAKAEGSGKVKMADRTTEAEWNTFDYEKGWCQEAGSKAAADDWKDEAVCRAIEKEYWSSLIWGKPPMYGADLEGTLFTDETKDWNVGHLDNVLTRLKLKRKLKGVTTPYLYFGMWRATFAWHVEDVDLYSINYVHFGAPKQWYSIRQSDRQRFELAMAGAFPGDSSRCRHFMRHKSYLASPSFLSSNNIKPLKLVQHAGEFVITYPYGYHSGYNLGFNCAESLNFALESWIPIGRRAGYCLCDPDAVHMDIDALLEESEELEEMERRKELKQRGQMEHDARLELRRQRDRERRRQKKLEMEQLGNKAAPPSSSATQKSGSQNKESDEAPQPDNCVFCPYNLDDDLVPLRADAKGRQAHRFCSNFMPECWVGQEEEAGEDGQEVVMGFESINKARWSLKCQLCETPQLAKKGAKIQCTYSKCSRTTHASCALKETSGWLLDVVSDPAADRLEGKAPATSNEEVEEDDEEEATRMIVLCKQHNPEQKQREALRKAMVLKACANRLKEGQNVRVRTNKGVWMTTLVEVRGAPPSEDKLREGSIVTSDGSETPWSKILFDQEVVKVAEEEVQRLMESEEALQRKESEDIKSELDEEKMGEERHQVCEEQSLEEAKEVDDQITLEQGRVQDVKHEHKAQDGHFENSASDETMDTSLGVEQEQSKPKKRKRPQVQGPWTASGEAPQLIRKAYQKRKKVEAPASLETTQAHVPPSRNIMALDHMMASSPTAAAADTPQMSVAPPSRPISAPQHYDERSTFMAQPREMRWDQPVQSSSHDSYYHHKGQQYAEQTRTLVPPRNSQQHYNGTEHPPTPHAQPFQRFSHHPQYPPHPGYQSPPSAPPQQRLLYHHPHAQLSHFEQPSSTLHSIHQSGMMPHAASSLPHRSDMRWAPYPPPLPLPKHHQVASFQRHPSNHLSYPSYPSRRP